MIIKHLLVVAAGGALGSVARYGLHLITGKTHSFPYSTFIANIAGSYLIGLFAAWLLTGQDENLDLRLFLITGICGGFTTFSAIQWETLTLLKEGKIALAILYIFLSFTVGLAAVFFGYKSYQSFV